MQNRVGVSINLPLFFIFQSIQLTSVQENKASLGNIMDCRQGDIEPAINKSISGTSNATHTVKVVQLNAKLSNKVLESDRRTLFLSK